jgi:hypothetical protein
MALYLSSIISITQINLLIASHSQPVEHEIHVICTWSVQLTNHIAESANRRMAESGLRG